MGKSGMDGILPSKKSKPKKKDKKKAATNTPAKGRKNHKAFNVANVVSAKRNMQRNLDKAQQKEVVPLLSREEAEAPPAMVVVMGPKGVGKSTLIRSLVKIYTGQNLTDTKGPITVVAGQKRRVTFFECPLDLYSMTDLAKVADLVLLVIDASYGFEMETFEYLNLLQLHGFPKVMGVLTHLDKFRSMKSLQSTKKAIKHRFWTEIYKGAKMFDFMGVQNGKYRKHEVKRLSLYVSRVKFRPLIWRNTHPYLVVDRVEDVTPSGQSNDGDKDVTLYGYIRGSHFKSNTKVHLIGAGDFDIHNMSALPDPCPSKHHDEVDANGKIRKGRSLSKKKENLLYAPMANVGRVSMDKDSMYIELKNINYSKRDQLYLPDQQGASTLGNGPMTGPMELLRSMQDVKEGVDTQLKKSQRSLDIFANSASRGSNELGTDDEDNSDNEDDDDDHSNSEDSYDRDDDDEDEGEFDEEDEDDEEDGDQEDDEDDEESEEDEDGDDNEEDEDDDIDDRRKVGKRPAAFRFGDSTGEDDGDEGGDGYDFSNPMLDNMTDVMKLVYGDDWLQSNTTGSSNKSKNGKGKKNLVDDDEDDGDFFKVKATSKTSSDDIDELNALDSSRTIVRRLPGSDAYKKVENYKTNHTNYLLLKQRFVTGGWKAPITAKGTGSGGEVDDDDQSVGEGEFEDLEGMGGPSHGIGGGDDDDDEGFDSDKQEAMNDKIDQELRELNAKKKAAFKAGFDDKYDKKKSGEPDDEEEMDENQESLIAAAARKNEMQHERNKKEFGDEGELARHRYEGFRQGLYVRMHLKAVPVEFLNNFDASRPVICGGLLPSETAMGYLNARVKRHRWHKRVLKSTDPLIFSIGWRRYQTIPIYTTTDQNDRERYLKYTPEHMHCTATFYGPLVAPNTGILAYQRVDNTTAGFRIALTGTALEQRATPHIVKKLKLVGTPLKIYKNTAFISGMFNSALEVAKFEHAKIKTVSGIRGSIKKAVNDKNDIDGVIGGQKVGKLPPGTFRATFEDKILMSDIVICRMWVNVEPKKFYNPVLSMLSKGDGQQQLLLMRSTAQIRKDEKIAQQVNKDSIYKPIERIQREFKKLKVPAKLQEALPFASKIKNESSKNRKSYLARRAVILEPEEKKSRAMVQMLSTIRKDKEAKRLQSAKEKQKEKQKIKLREAERFSDVQREDKKRKYREAGLERERKLRKANK